MPPSAGIRPHAFERSFFAVIALAGLAPFAMLSAVPFAFGRPSTLWIGWLMLAGVAAWLFALGRCAWRHRRMLRRVRRLDGAACPNCVYDLTHFVGDRCPECGLSTTRALAREQWASVVRISVLAS